VSLSDANIHKTFSLLTVHISAETALLSSRKCNLRKLKVVLKTEQVAGVKLKANRSEYKHTGIIINYFHQVMTYYT